MLMGFIIFFYNFVTFIDSNTESRRFPATSPAFNVYVPRDEQFGHQKTSDFLAFSLKGLVTQIIPLFEAFVDFTPNEFESFKEVDNLFYNGIPLPTGVLNTIVNQIPLPMIKEIFRTDGQRLLKYPVPQVIKGKTKYCLIENLYTIIGLISMWSLDFAPNIVLVSKQFFYLVLIPKTI